jgi:hypothetical protein
MNMRKARRLHPGGATSSFRQWVRGVWEKFHEISGDGNVTGKLAEILRQQQRKPANAGADAGRQKAKGR